MKYRIVEKSDGLFYSQYSQRVLGYEFWRNLDNSGDFEFCLKYLKLLIKQREKLTIVKIYEVE